VKLELLCHAGCCSTTTATPAWMEGVVMFYLCLFCPSDNVWYLLPTRLCASVRTHFYYYYTFLDHTTNISRKVLTPRHGTACRERKIMFKIVTWKKQTWTKHHNTGWKHQHCRHIHRLRDVPQALPQHLAGQAFNGQSIDEGVAYR